VHLDGVDIALLHGGRHHQLHGDCLLLMRVLLASQARPTLHSPVLAVVVVLFFQLVVLVVRLVLLLLMW
jgi:hypothetical protein